MFLVFLVVRILPVAILKALGLMSLVVRILSIAGLRDLGLMSLMSFNGQNTINKEFGWFRVKIQKRVKEKNKTWLKGVLATEKR